MSLIMSEKTKPMMLTGKISIPFSYAAGETASRFYNGLKQGKILATQCDLCRRIMVPARSFCAHCFKKTDAFLEVKGIGTLITWTETSSAENGHAAFGIVHLDGTSNGFLHRLEIAKGRKIEIGTRMKAVFKREQDRTGSMDDILCFRPVGGEEE